MSDNETMFSKKVEQGVLKKKKSFNSPFKSFKHSSEN